jgi:hypothetical protein
MVSGFFSALNSFSDSFEDLGTISELKLSNNNLKLSFLKDNNVPDLIYLATYDKDSNHNEVQRFLQEISNLFLQNYDLNQILNWNGRLDSFKSFNSVIEDIFKRKEKHDEDNYNKKVVDWIRSFETVKEDHEEPKYNSTISANPEYFDYIPIFTTSKKINPKYYLTGDTSCRVYEQIDGKRSINQISIELNVKHNQVYNICKNLIKMGFISLN